MNYDVIVLAGGRGVRSQLPYNKVFHKINERFILDYALTPFLKDSRCQRVVLVYNQKDSAVIATAYGEQEKIRCVAGGKTRQESVANGLKEVSESIVLIHDGARPLVDHRLLDRVLNGLTTHEACAPAIAIPDTIKKVENGCIVANIDRTNLMRLQTPQAFETEALKRCYNQTKKPVFSCDISLYEALSGKKARIVSGAERNMKFTGPHDVKLLEMMLNDAHRT